MLTYVCIASGPSLTKEQVDIARDSDAIIIATNNNYQLCPDADFLLACDLRWWRKYYRDADAVTEPYCEFVAIENVVAPFMRHAPYPVNRPFIEYGVHRSHEHIGDKEYLYHGGNSGILAVEMARVRGAEKIVLIGYDHQHTNNKAHWFGDHPQDLINATNTDRWVREFALLSDAYEKLGIDLVNCSIETAINSCRRSIIEKEV